MGFIWKVCDGCFVCIHIHISMAIYPLAHKVHSYIPYGLVIYNVIYLCDIFEVTVSYMNVLL
jgi:hypothetical protein